MYAHVLNYVSLYMTLGDFFFCDKDWGYKFLAASVLVSLVFRPKGSVIMRFMCQESFNFS